jgi:uncharacterized cupin superfamily protein
VRPVISTPRVAVEQDPGAPPAYRARSAEIGPSLGAHELAATVYELDRGDSVGPYRYEHGNEQWLLVLEGRPTLRHAGGEDGLVPGDVVCLPEGPAGAHKLSNWRDETARVVVLGTVTEPAVTVYPDDGKLEVRPLGHVFRIADAASLLDEDR